MIIPQSHKVRHNILTFLADKRHVQQIRKPDIENAQFTIDEMIYLLCR